ncbi:MAG: pyridoxal-phosphate dependent enzyme [Candidatus Eremiobacteraeota bacterium]|nr:pyridoxal-phosphate dependent enzyme [Candidatus Eremiobacteraeota bacterium]MBV8364865.1 pyridoxal-phosphate dependent enzyme [Candidatus Eremiobacteraeota bacterium]
MSTTLAPPTVQDARAAAARIAPYVRRTPLIAHGGLTYKAEFQQVTGSFKPRGAFNAALQLSEDARARGLVAVSGGNHGLAVAHVGRRLGIRATVLMPKSTPAWMVDRAKADDAEVLLFDSIGLAFAEMEARTSAGQTPLHPFDDARVMAGQGTIALELDEDVPDLAQVVVSIGGGGLIGGIAAVIKALRPGVRVYGVETQGADAMRRALDAGHPVQLAAITSIARTLGAPAVSERTLAATRALVDEVVVVSDAQAVRSLLQLRAELGVDVEPASSCTHAALSAGLIPQPASGSTVVILCGSNVGRDEIEQWRLQFGL